MDLFDDPDLGASLWSETHQNVAVEYGFLSLPLGTVNTVTPLSDALMANSGTTLYFEITLGGLGYTFPARIPVTSVPYALVCSEAGNAETLQGLGPDAFAYSGHDHAWGEIAGKPSEFPPDTHTHPWSELTEVPTDLSDGAISWSEVTGKPGEFPPDTHDHDGRYCTETEVDTLLAGKSDTTHDHDADYVNVGGDAMTGKLAIAVSSGDHGLAVSKTGGDTGSAIWAVSQVENTPVIWARHSANGNVLQLDKMVGATGYALTVHSATPQAAIYSTNTNSGSTFYGIKPENSTGNAIYATSASSDPTIKALNSAGGSVLFLYKGDGSTTGNALTATSYSDDATISATNNYSEGGTGGIVFHAIKPEGSTGKVIQASSYNSDPTIWAVNSSTGMALRATKPDLPEASEGNAISASSCNSDATIYATNSGAGRALDVSKPADSTGYAIAAASENPDATIGASNNGAGAVVHLSKNSASGSMLVISSSSTSNDSNKVSINDNGGGHVVNITKDGSIGRILDLISTNASNESVKVYISDNGGGSALHVNKTGSSGSAIYAISIEDTLVITNDGSGSGILVSDNGDGDAIKAVNNDGGYAGHFTGDLYVSGTCSGGATCDEDIAENFFATEDVEAGDVVAMDDLAYKRLAKSAGPYDPAVVGVVSTAPTMVMGRDEKKELLPEDLIEVPLALTGVVPVKVSTESGPIAVGDFLTSSSTPGVAMKATRSGTVIGKALEPFDGSGGKLGKVRILVGLSSIQFNEEWEERLETFDAVASNLSYQVLRLTKENKELKTRLGKLERQVGRLLGNH